MMNTRSSDNSVETSKSSLNITDENDTENIRWKGITHTKSVLIKFCNEKNKVTVCFEALCELENESLTDIIKKKKK